MDSPQWNLFQELNSILGWALTEIPYHQCPCTCLGNWRLAQVGLEDGNTGLLIRKRNIDELIEAARSQDSRINNVRSIGSANNKHILFCRHAIHFCQDLVDDSVCSPTAISNVATTGLGNWIQLIKEQYTGGSLAGLWERYTDSSINITGSLRPEKERKLKWSSLLQNKISSILPRKSYLAAKQAKRQLNCL